MSQKSVSALHRAFLAGVVCVSAFVASAALTKIEVADGQTYELAADAAANAVNCVHQSGTLLVLGEGCTVKLTGTAATEGEDFVLRAGVKCASGDFTIDGTELVNYSKTLKWRGSAVAGCANVTGFDALRYGTESAGSKSDINFITFAADIKGVPVAFGGGVYMVKTPVSTTFSYESGALLWPGSVEAMLHDADNASTNEFGALEVEGWDIGLVIDSIRGKTDIPYDKVRIHGSNALAFRPCGVSVTDTDVGGWGGSTGGGNDCDIELVDAESALETYHSRLGYLKGDISGAGSVLIKNVGPICFDGRLTYTGETKLSSDGAKIVIADATPATSQFNFGKYNYVEFTAPTTTINKIISPESKSCVYLPANGVLNVGVVTGTFAFTNTTGKVVIDKLEGGTSIITVDEGAEVVVKDCDAGAIIKVMSESAMIGFGEEGTHPGVTFADAVPEGAELTVTSGRFDFARDFRNSGCAKLSTVRVAGAAEAVVPADCPFAVIAAGGKVIRASVSSAKIAFWGDADKVDSFVFSKDMNPDLGVKDYTISLWKDCREAMTDWSFAWTRFRVADTTEWNKYTSVRVDRIANGLNGRAYVELGAGNKRLAVWPGQTMDWTTNPGRTKVGQMPSEYAIVVAKKATLSGTSNGATMLGDLDYKLSRPVHNTAALFTNENVIVYRDGAQVDTPTATPYNIGKWEVYSYTTDGAKIIGLSSDDPSQNTGGGGFDVAEVMVFSEVPTPTERVAYENYLAAKWGLTVTHTPVEESLVNTLTVAGRGELVFTEPNVGAVDVADFVGKITLTDLLDATDTVAFTVGGGDDAPFTVTKVALDREQKKLVVDFALPDAPQPRDKTVYAFFQAPDGWTMEIGSVTNPRDWNYKLSTENGVTTFSLNPPGFVLILR